MLIDGLKIRRSWEGRLLAIFLTFFPPLFFVYSYQRGFLLALEYAGVFVAVLLIFLPSMLVWKIKAYKFYQKLEGRIIILSVIIFSFIVIVSVILKNWGFFDGILSEVRGV